MILISTRDGDVLAISRHKRELEQFYHVPMPAYDTVEKLVHKRSFYKMLGEMGIPYPKTWFPESLDEVGRIGRDIAYPFIIKPSYSPAFQWRFGLKLFVINSAQELETAIKRLDGSNLDVFIQEIIPGRRVYEFFTCLNGESEPLAVCGWDKIRSYPTDFGTGTFCESVWRPAAVECGIRFLRAVGYSGIAAPELKRDTRDGEYKFLEVNPRVTLQNGMAAACGVDIVYIAYLDVSGDYISELVAPREGVLWVDDFVDMLSFVIYLLRGEVGFGEMLKSLRPRKVHSVLSWDDPLPGIVRMGQAGCSALRKLSRK